MAAENSPSFTLSGLGSAFAHRQRDLFACLDAADKEREATPKQPLLHPHEDEDDRPRQRPRSPVEQGRRREAPTKQFRGKESIFKRPEMPAPRRARNSLADHQRNPHKWTKYSLGDVSSQDMSDRSNTAAALSFLQELKARKDNSSDMDVDEPSPTKPIVFKPVRPKTERLTSSLGAVSTVSTSATSEEGDRPSFRSSKLVMPEYVVGQKTTSKKKSRTGVSQAEDKGKGHKQKEISLGHLLDEEDDE
ncbi:protein TSSC4 [Thrips palmi]|uniref:U5 small nuclear ribonucleoprotein TSSC4 n=1 Tax=Thrips palmi TaxID=161013 RepID=A0A6P8ZZ59_THRPL|nr:protein TSSC4 [Thrips palmi]